MGRNEIKINEFSKWFIVVVTKIFIAGVIFGAVIVTAQLVGSFITCGAITVDLSSYLTFVAVPLSCGVMGYMAKAAFENREKIRRNTKKDEEKDYSAGCDIGRAE